MKKLLTLFTLLLTVCSGAWADAGDVLFTQNFSGTGSLTYTQNVGLTKTIGLTGIVGNDDNLFTSITTSNKNSTGIAINNATGGNDVDATGIFQAYFNNTSGYWSIARTNDFAAIAPTALKMSMDFYVDIISGSSNAAGVYFAIGDGFADGLKSTSAQTATLVHSGFGLTSENKPTICEYNTPGTDIYNTALENKTWYSMIWIINNTGETLQYDNPTGSGTTNLNDDSFDIWLKTQAGAITTYTKIITNHAATTGSKDLQEMYIGNVGGKKHEFRLDNVMVTDLTPSVTPAAPTISVNAISLSTPQNVSVELTATATGSPNPTITWYQSATAVASGGTEKATGTSYSPDVTTIGTYYFYAVASNGVDPDAVSDVITFTVAPKLNSLVYSNGFKAFIQQPGAGNGKIKAYYIAGTDAPTVSSFTATTDATYNVEDNTLTLTAADGKTTAVYDITLAPVTPYSGTGEYTFTASDSWVKAGNSFDTGWKIARSYESDSEKKFMISTGSNRLYLFLAPSTSLTITQNGSTNRDMLVSIDGGDAVEKSAAKTFTVTGKDDAAYMVEISQKNDNGGDGKISKVNIKKTGFESGIITASGWNTFSSSSKLDLSTIVGGKAYVATATDENVTLTKTTAIVEAEEGLMINGTPNAAFKIDTTNDVATFEGNNLLVGLPNGGTVAVAGEGYYNYVFGWTTNPAEPGFYLIDGDTPTLGANKAYLHTTTAFSGKLNIIIDDSTSQEEETDGIKAVSTKVENGVRYNLAGQKVGADYKGIVIVNGKKMLNK